MAKKYNDMRLLTDRLRSLLKTRNLTQAMLAEELDVTPRYVSRFFHDKMINEELLIEVAKVVDCNPFYLTDPDCSLLPFASYESFNYNYDDCVRGLLHMQQYAPGDYSKEELDELKKILGRQIDVYSAQHNKRIYDAAFWVGEASDAGIAYIKFDKEEGGGARD